ncbi:ATP-dependent carboxylate-amine ligase [Streptomyces smyrnaeus]|uniref:ATP-grasp domain-containing protein n=1 Tax=Streptomyces smyrnaeus TaxID=1387713 RepID=UPI0033B6DCC7
MRASSERGAVVLVDSDYADTPYDKWAADAGIGLELLVSGNRFPQYRHVPGARCFPDYRTGGTLEQAVLETLTTTPAQSLVARAESDLLRAARLREVLGIPGQNWDSALAFRDKVLMKTLVAEAGLAVPDFAPIRVLVDLLAFLRQHGYPVVVKPAYGSGSTGTHVLRGPEDLSRLLNGPLPEYAQVERFVTGTMYVVDGLVVEGEPVTSFVSRYLNDCLSYRSGTPLGSTQLTSDDPLVPRLIDFAHRVLGALPTPRCTSFHLEVFHTPEDELVLCEVASRTGGALTAAAIRAASGIDLDREWFLAQAVPRHPAPRGATGVEPGRAAGWVVFYPRSGQLEALPQDPPPFVAEERHRGTVGAIYQGGAKSGVYLSGYVVTGGDAAQVEQRVDELVQWYAAESRWRD